jgi:nucleoside-diphosphate-sugar epimerase
MVDRRRILLLGANGFVGRHVRAALEEGGDEVLGVSGMGASGVPAWRATDLASADLDLLVAEADADVVVNCAGRTHGSPDALANANVTLVARLLAAIAGQPARLVHIGSSAEYGPGIAGQPTREGDPVRPVAPYGITKLEATRLVTGSGLPATVLRVFNPVGAGMARDSMPGTAASAIAGALVSGHDAITLGDLSARRDFVDVRDVADAVATASRHGALSPVINLGSGRATQARELVSVLAAVAGFTGEVREVENASLRSGGVDYQCADIGLARQELGWEPTRSLRDAVAELWASTGASPA